MVGDTTITRNGTRFLMNGNRQHKKASKFIEGFFQLLTSLFCLATLLFFIYSSFSSNPIEILASKSNQTFPQAQLSQEHRSQLREHLGLNGSLTNRLGHFFTDIFRGSMGTSFWTGQSVGQLIGPRIPVTFMIIVPAFFLFLALGIVWGTFQAIQIKTRTGKIASFVNASLFCVPAFSLASGLARLPLPLSSEFLALLVYVGATVPTLASLVCDRLLEEEKQLYAQAARAKGLSRRQLFQRHLLKSCIPSLLSVVPWWWSVVLGTSIIAEPIFRISGIGMLSFEAFRNQDIPVLLAISLLLGCGRVLLGCLRDLVWGDAR